MTSADADFRSARPALLRARALCRRRRARRRAGAEAVRRDRRPRRWSRTRSRRSPACARLERDAGRARARRRASSSARAGLPTARASRSRAAAARRARRDRGQRARRACSNAAPRADDWVLVHDAARCLVRAEWIDRADRRLRATTPVGGLLALPVADTLKRETRRPRRRDARPRDAQLAGADAADVPPRRCCADALARAGADVDRRGERDRGASACAPKLVPGSPENFKITQPGRLRARRGACCARRRRRRA